MLRRSSLDSGKSEKQAFSIYKLTEGNSALIGAPVVGFMDESICAFRLMRTPAFSGSAVSVASHDAISKSPKKASTGLTMKSREKLAVSSKTAKVPRPPNAFILYRQHHHPKIKEAYPDFQNNDICKLMEPQNRSRVRLTNLAIMLGKQWKAEPDEVRTHYKALADEQKKKHAEQHPDYQYAPRRPCERKRRASSRQYPKHSKAAAAAGIAAAGKSSSSAIQAESPTSISSTATFSNSSNVSTPGMQNGINMDHDLSNLNVFLGPNDLQDEHFNFDTVSFDAMVQQLRNSQNPDILLQPLNPADEAGLESFEFSDFIADCF